MEYIFFTVQILTPPAFELIKLLPVYYKCHFYRSKRR